MRIGVAGIGKMGAAIAARLIEAGHEVTVWNRTPDKAKAVAGASLATTPAELTLRADVIISSLTDAAALDAVYNASQGLLSGSVGGKLFIDMSTVLPATEIALAEAVRAKGGAFVECPVGGSTGPARQGRLIGLAGGGDADVARARPILEQLCRRLEHAGPVGSGAVLKFAVNLPLMVYWQALGEALALTRKLPIAPERLMDLLSDTSGAATIAKVRAPGVAAMLKGGDPGPVTFNVDGGIKDMKAMLGEAQSRGVALPVLAQTLACYEETKRLRGGAAEISTVSAYWADRRQP
ncbi:MAG TPA: NAD(P)-dependent oxidoreductase [Xanthobacteraceae bacterium]|jgi:3-hydroxyisobutyrate dehydrogenase|nr:NAD(P)-dependent oxidoreductase [Xanthobacteraceae bacterium]